MTIEALAPPAHTSPWATEENFWLEGPDFYRAHMVDEAEMWLPDREDPRRGNEILDALKNVPRWESVRFSDQEMEVDDDTVTLCYTATARREGQDVYTARCKTVYRRETGGIKLVEHHQDAI